MAGTRSRGLRRNIYAVFLVAPSQMRPLSILFIAALLAMAAALPRRRSLKTRIPIQKRLTLTKDGIVDLDAMRSHLAYSERYATFDNPPYPSHFICNN